MRAWCDGTRGEFRLQMLTGVHLSRDDEQTEIGECVARDFRLHGRFRRITRRLLIV